MNEHLRDIDYRPLNSLTGLRFRRGVFYGFKWLAYRVLPTTGNLSRNI